MDDWAVLSVSHAVTDLLVLVEEQVPIKLGVENAVTISNSFLLEMYNFNYGNQILCHRITSFSIVKTE